MRKELLEQSNWDYCQPVTIGVIGKNEELIQKRFPRSYKTLMLQFNAGMLSDRLCMFRVKDYPYPLSIDVFCSLKGSGRLYSDVGDYYSEMHYEFSNPIENMPKDLIIFGGEGCGDYICFDYRNDSDTDNPPIVYWKHDAEPGKGLFFVANTFDEFLDMLYPYSEHDTE